MGAAMSVRKRRWITSKGETKEAWIVDYVDQIGVRHIETFERKKDADEYQATVRVDVRKGTHLAPSKSPTVAEAADTWLKEVMARNIERTTLRHYEQHVSLHIVPLIGRTKLAALNHDRVKHFRDELLSKLTRTLARKVLVSFKSLLKVSHYSHVATNVTIPKGHKEKRRIEPGRDFPTTAEVARLLAAAEGDTKRRALLLILAFAGLRASEVRGLRWSDIDLKSSELHVRQRADAYNVIGAPKSNSSARTIPLDPEVMVPALREWKLKCPPSDFVFPTRTGKPQAYTVIRESSIDPVMKAAKLVDKDGAPKYTPHALRHFFASWCINPKARGGRELPPKQVQYLLGHSTIAMTFDIYGHLFPSEGNRDELTAAVRKLLA
jgi:integrase